MYKDTSMEIIIWLSWLILPIVLWGNKLHQSSLEESTHPALRWSAPAVCSACLDCFSEEFTIALGSPSSSLSITAFFQMGRLVFCSCVWPDCPMRSLSQAHPLNARLRVGHNALIWTGGKKMKHVVSLKIFLLAKPPVSPYLVGYKCRTQI